MSRRHSIDPLLAAGNVTMPLPQGAASVGVHTETALAMPRARALAQIVPRAAGPLCAFVLALGLVACSSTPLTPSTSDLPATPPPPADAGAAKSTGYDSAVAQAASPDAAASSVPAPLDLPPRATADFERAVNLMRAGNQTEAELEFRQLAETYPRLAAPYVNLGLLYRKAGKLDQAEDALTAATARNAASAVAWNELGVTRRMRGRFTESAEAYERAIAADDAFAPAHRNYAVLLDLYLGQPERALSELERYKELSGEEKPVNGWIAELRQRTGKAVPPAPKKEQAQEADPAAGSEPAQPAGEAAQPAEGSPAQSAPPPSGATGERA